MMTTPSVTSAVDGHVSRDARLTTILLVGRMTNGVRDDLCRVRNISPGGMQIETLAPIDVGQRICVDLKNGTTMQSEVVWVGKDQAGMRFDAPVDVGQVLAPADRSRLTPGARMMRSPRLSTRCPAVLRRMGESVRGMLVDISQGGALISAAPRTRIDDRFVLLVPGLEPRRAAIRWQAERVIGLAFEEKIGFADLSRWLVGPDRFTLEPAAISPKLRSS